MYRIILTLACLAFSFSAQAKMVSFLDKPWNPFDDSTFNSDFISEPGSDDHFIHHNPFELLGDIYSIINSVKKGEEPWQPGSILEVLVEHIYNYHPKLWEVLERHPFFEDYKPVSEVPLPATGWLFITALIGLFGRKFQSH